MYPHIQPPSLTASLIDILHHSGPFIIINEFTLTHHCHLNPQLTFEFTFGAVQPVGLDKCI
jgi:hypothetical protein